VEVEEVDRPAAKLLHKMQKRRSHETTTDVMAPIAIDGDNAFFL